MAALLRWNDVSVSELTTVFHRSYIPLVEWRVEFTDEFEVWWNGLSEEEQIVIAAKVELLEKFGPTLPRPRFS